MRMVSDLHDGPGGSCGLQSEFRATLVSGETSCPCAFRPARWELPVRLPFAFQLLLVMTNRAAVEAACKKLFCKHCRFVSCPISPWTRHRAATVSSPGRSPFWVLGVFCSEAPRFWSAVRGGRGPVWVFGKEKNADLRVFWNLTQVADQVELWAKLILRSGKRKVKWSRDTPFVLLQKPSLNVDPTSCLQWRKPDEQVIWFIWVCVELFRVFSSVWFAKGVSVNFNMR